MSPAAFWLCIYGADASKSCFQAVFTYVLGLLTNGYVREKLWKYERIDWTLALLNL